jgi:hypothetical protein
VLHPAKTKAFLATASESPRALSLEEGAGERRASFTIMVSRTIQFDRSVCVFATIHAHSATPDWLLPPAGKKPNKPRAVNHFQGASSTLPMCPLALACARGARQALDKSRKSQYRGRLRGLVESKGRGGMDGDGAYDCAGISICAPASKEV